MILPWLPSIAIRSPACSTRSPIRTSPAARSTSHGSRARDRRAAHAAGDQRGMAGLAALAREDPAGGVEAGDVVGLGEGAHEDHVAALGGGRDGVAGAQHDLALRGARGGGDAGREHLVVGGGVEGRVQQRVQGGGVDRQDRRLAVEQPLGDGVDGEAHRGLRGRFALRVWSM